MPGKNGAARHEYGGSRGHLPGQQFRTRECGTKDLRGCCRHSQLPEVSSYFCRGSGRVVCDVGQCNADVFELFKRLSGSRHCRRTCVDNAVEIGKHRTVTTGQC